MIQSVAKMIHLERNDSHNLLELAVRFLDKAWGHMIEMAQLDCCSRDTVDHLRAADARYSSCCCMAQEGEGAKLMDQSRDISQVFPGRVGVF